MFPDKKSTSLVIFCKVVDNFGDIGICWRLARQLQHEHDVAVTLWVDDLKTFQRICPPVALDEEIQQTAGVTVRQWRDQDGVFTPADVADIVIEFFGCDIPPGYIEAMVGCEPHPVWLNLEGLSAEEWVEGCHTLSSPHPCLPLTKYFYFPGFTANTGGLMREAALEEQRVNFRADPKASAAFLAKLGVMPAELAARKVSLFCYPHAPVAALFATWQAGATPVLCLVPEGVAADTVRAFIGADPAPGAAHTRGALTVRVLPFVPQPDYDKLLWACDLNFVRGEDSIVRAQWAGRPFVWHIYPQDEDLHHKKLRAFLNRYSPDIDSANAFNLLWNGAAGESATVAAAWAPFEVDLERVTRRSTAWQAEMLANGDLVTNMLKFAASKTLGGARN